MTERNIRRRFTEKQLTRYMLAGIKNDFIIVAMVLSAFSAACAADLTVAVVRSDGVLPVEEVLSGFKAELQQRNLDAHIISFADEGNPQRLIAHVERSRPDVIVCLGTKALEMSAHIKSIPKLATLMTYGSLTAWQNGNDIYGVAIDVPPALKLRIIRQVFHEQNRIGMLYEPTQNLRAVEEIRKIASTMGFQLHAFPVGSLKEIPPAFKKMENQVDLLLTLYDQIVYSPEAARYILMQSLRKRIPVVGFSPHYAKAGTLLAVYGDYQDMGRQAADQVVALVKGNGKDVRVLRPRKVRVAVNLKVAQIMGYKFTPQFMKTVHLFY